MKTFNLATTILFCVFFVNISTAQISKKQQTNKQYPVKGIKMTPNIKNDNLLKVEKDVTSIYKQKDEVKQNQIISKLNKNQSKIKMIKPTTVVPNTNQTKTEESIQEKGYKYKLDYLQQIKIKEAEDE